MAERDGEAGFTLIELSVCVGLTIAACVVALGVLPSLVRASQSGLLRDAAATIARAAIDRARAATAYYPAAGYQPNHAYALNATATYAASSRVHRAWCGSNVPSTDVAMSVRASYDATSDALTVTVSYPRDGCDVTHRASVSVTERLPPSALAPGTIVTTPVGDPSLQ